MATTPTDDASTAAQLDNVLTRLALTEEDALERVLSALLPRLLGQVCGASALVGARTAIILPQQLFTLFSSSSLAGARRR